MSLRQRMDRLEDRLNPNPENLLTILVTQFTPITDPKSIKAPRHYVSPHFVAIFLGGTEAQRRKELKRLRRDPKYQRDPLRRSAQAGADGRTGREGQDSIRGPGIVKRRAI
jgi:hypothetical protein